MREYTNNEKEEAVKIFDRSLGNKEAAVILVDMLIHATQQMSLQGIKMIDDKENKFELDVDIFQIIKHIDLFDMKRLRRLGLIRNWMFERKS